MIILISAILSLVVSAERFSPSYHYSHSGGAIQDPTALFRDLNGNYNMFYLHNGDPNSTLTNKSMNWGHAMSTDLVSWTTSSLVFRASLNQTYL